MTDAERFDLVLAELGQLFVRLGDLTEHVVLVGGQALAIEARETTGSAALSVETATGTIVTRGFTMEPDLLFDVDASEGRLDQLTVALRECGFQRTGRSFRWAKKVGEVPIELDLFCPEGVDEDVLPTPMTVLPGGGLAIARSKRIEVMLGLRRMPVAVADPLGFLTMKLEAKLRLRPEETKDSFDLFAYVSFKGAEAVATALRSTKEGEAVFRDLQQLFATESSPGVLDVLASAPTLVGDEGALLARAVVDLFDDLVARAR
jgi:hypothetical protein